MMSGKILDIYGYGREGSEFVITKNGEFYLIFTGSEDEAKNLVQLLNNDERKAKNDE